MNLLLVIPVQMELVLVLVEPVLVLEVPIPRKLLEPILVLADLLLVDPRLVLVLVQERLDLLRVQQRSTTPSISMVTIQYRRQCQSNQSPGSTEKCRRKHLNGN